MRAVWSFWSKPFLAQKGRLWREPWHHLLAWGLSVRLASKHYPDTMLVTDRAGAELLVERLGLRFTHVRTDLDQLRDADAGWWALGKLIAYSVQDRPFVHLDTDVFLWKPLPARLESAAVFTQCPEAHPPLGEWNGPGDIEAAFTAHSLLLPTEWQWVRSQSSDGFREENCGIVGGTHVDFVRYFSTLGLELALNPAYARAWAELPHKAAYMTMIEQFLLAACLDYHRTHSGSPFSGIRGRHLFSSWAQAFDPLATARVGYTHLLGDAKNHPDITQRLEHRMQREDPELFRRCMRVAQTASPAGMGA
jgi:hypothetical protein